MGLLVARAATTPTSWSRSAASTRASVRRRCRSRRRGGSRSTSSTPRSRASGPRATSRSPPTRCSSARAPSSSSASARSASSGTSRFDALFQFSPFYFIIEHLVVVLGQGVRRRRLFGVCASGSSSRGRRRGGPTASAGISLLFFDIDVDIDVTWGESATRRCRRSRCCRARSTSSARPTTGGRGCRRARNLLVVAAQAARGGGDARAAPARHAAGQPAAVPLDIKLDKVGSRSPPTRNRFSLAAAERDLRQARRRRRALRAGRSSRISPTTSGCPQAASRSATAASSSPTPAASSTSGASINRVVRYELIIVDTELPAATGAPFSALSALAVRPLPRRRLGRRCRRSAPARRRQRVPFADGVQTKRGVRRRPAPRQRGLRRRRAVFASEGEARELHGRARWRGDRELAGKLHVRARLRARGMSDA